MRIEREYIVERLAIRRGCANRHEPARMDSLTLAPAPGQGGGGGDAGPINIYGSPDDSIKLKDLGKVLKKMNRNFAFV